MNTLLKIILTILGINILLISTTNAETFCDVEGVPLGEVLHVKKLPKESSDVIWNLPGNASSYRDDAQKFTLVKCETITNGSTWCKIIIYPNNKAMMGWVNSNYLDCYVKNHAPI